MPVTVMLAPVPAVVMSPAPEIAIVALLPSEIVSPALIVALAPSLTLTRSPAPPS
jgi:hypothetical protein